MKICFMLQDTGKGFRDESLWLLVAYVMLYVCNVECNPNVRNIYSFGKIFPKIHVGNQFEYGFSVFLGTDLSLTTTHDDNFGRPYVICSKYY